MLMTKFLPTNMGSIFNCERIDRDVLKRKIRGSIIARSTQDLDVNATREDARALGLSINEIVNEIKLNEGEGDTPANQERLKNLLEKRLLLEEKEKLIKDNDIIKQQAEEKLAAENKIKAESEERERIAKSESNFDKAISEYKIVTYYSTEIESFNDNGRKITTKGTAKYNNNEEKTLVTTLRDTISDLDTDNTIVKPYTNRVIEVEMLRDKISVNSRTRIDSLGLIPNILSTHYSNTGSRVKLIDDRNNQVKLRNDFVLKDNIYDLHKPNCKQQVNYHEYVSFNPFNDINRIRIREEYKTINDNSDMYSTIKPPISKEDDKVFRRSLNPVNNYNDLSIESKRNMFRHITENMTNRITSTTCLHLKLTICELQYMINQQYEGTDVIINNMSKLPSNITVYDPDDIADKLLIGELFLSSDLTRTTIFDEVQDSELDIDSILTLLCLVQNEVVPLDCITSPNVYDRVGNLIHYSSNFRFTNNDNDNKNYYIISRRKMIIESQIKNFTTLNYFDDIFKIRKARACLLGFTNSVCGYSNSMDMLNNLFSYNNIANDMPIYKNNYTIEQTKLPFMVGLFALREYEVRNFLISDINILSLDYMTNNILIAFLSFMVDIFQHEMIKYNLKERDTDYIVDLIKQRIKNTISEKSGNGTHILIEYFEKQYSLQFTEHYKSKFYEMICNIVNNIDINGIILNLNSNGGSSVINKMSNSGYLYGCLNSYLNGWSSRTFRCPNSSVKTFSVAQNRFENLIYTNEDNIAANTKLMFTEKLYEMKEEHDIVDANVKDKCLNIALNEYNYIVVPKLMPVSGTIINKCTINDSGFKLTKQVSQYNDNFDTPKLSTRTSNINTYQSTFDKLSIYLFENSINIEEREIVRVCKLANELGKIMSSRLIVYICEDTGEYYLIVDIKPTIGSKMSNLIHIALDELNKMFKTNVVLCGIEDLKTDKSTIVDIGANVQVILAKVCNITIMRAYNAGSNKLSNEEIPNPVFKKGEKQMKPFVTKIIKENITDSTSKGDKEEVKTQKDINADKNLEKDTKLSANKEENIGETTKLTELMDTPLLFDIINDLNTTDSGDESAASGKAESGSGETEIPDNNHGIEVEPDDDLKLEPDNVGTEKFGSIGKTKKQIDLELIDKKRRESVTDQREYYNFYGDKLAIKDIASTLATVARPSINKKLKRRFSRLTERDIKNVIRNKDKTMLKLYAYILSHRLVLDVDFVFDDQYYAKECSLDAIIGQMIIYHDTEIDREELKETLNNITNRTVIFDNNDFKMTDLHYLLLSYDITLYTYNVTRSCFTKIGGGEKAMMNISNGTHTKTAMFSTPYDHPIVLYYMLLIYRDSINEGFYIYNYILENFNGQVYDNIPTGLYNVFVKRQFQYDEEFQRIIKIYISEIIKGKHIMTAMEFISSYKDEQGKRIDFSSRANLFVVDKDEQDNKLYQSLQAIERNEMYQLVEDRSCLDETKIKELEPWKDKVEDETKKE